MTVALWIIAACQVTERLTSIRGLRRKGLLRPIDALRKARDERQRVPLSPTNMP